MEAYSQGKPSYFATPATTLLPALNVALDEVLNPSIDATFARCDNTDCM